MLAGVTHVGVVASASAVAKQELKMLDPVGTVVELWDIKGAFLQSANFGDLSYDGNFDDASF